MLGVGRNRTPRARLKAHLLGEITIEVVLDGKEKKNIDRGRGVVLFLLFFIDGQIIRFMIVTIFSY